MSEQDLDRLICEENLKADHRDVKNNELIEFLDDCLNSGISCPATILKGFKATLTEIKGILEQEQRREENPWFCPECGEEYNGCCKEHIVRLEMVSLDQDLKVTTKGLNQPKDWECPHCGGTEAFPDPSGYATYQSGGWGCIECQS